MISIPLADPARAFTLLPFEIRTHVFFGTSPDFVLIVAGIHANEQSGIEVANWICSKLENPKKPSRLGAIVIPEVFPARAHSARTAEWKGENTYKWREITLPNGTTIFPARQFPPPGQPLSFLGPDKILKDDSGNALNIDDSPPKVALLPGIGYVIRVIEGFKPVRIVSVH